MNRIVRITLLFFLLVSFGAAEANVHSPYVPLPARLLEAELVVLGKISNVTETDDNEIGQLSVDRILKGSAKSDALTVEWPKQGKKDSAPVRGPVQYKPGTHGVWICARAPGAQHFSVSDPGAFMSAADIGSVEEQLARLKTLGWSEAQQGLQFAVVVEVTDVADRKVWMDGRLVAAQATVAIFPVVRNISDVARTVCNFSADHPFAATWSLAGKPDWQPELYSTPKDPQVQPAPVDFIRIAPNETRRIGHGFVLPPLVDQGKYNLSVTFASERESTAKDDVQAWKGKVKLPNYELRLPLPK